MENGDLVAYFDELNVGERVDVNEQEYQVFIIGDENSTPLQ